MSIYYHPPPRRFYPPAPVYPGPLIYHPVPYPVYAIPPHVSAGSAFQAALSAPIPTHFPVPGSTRNGYLTEERIYDYVGGHEGYRLRKLTQYGYEHPRSSSVPDNALSLSSSFSTLSLAAQPGVQCPCRRGLRDNNMSTKHCCCCQHRVPDISRCCTRGYDSPCRTQHVDSSAETPSGSRVTNFMSSKNPIEAVHYDCGGKAQCRKGVSFQQGANEELAHGAANRARGFFLDEKEREVNERLRVLEEREKAAHRSFKNANPNHQGYFSLSAKPLQTPYVSTYPSGFQLCGSCIEQNKAEGATTQPPKFCQSCLTDLERRLYEHKKQTEGLFNAAQHQSFVLPCSETGPPEGKSAKAHKGTSKSDGAFSPQEPLGVHKEVDSRYSPRTGGQTPAEESGSTRGQTTAERNGAKDQRTAERSGRTGGQTAAEKIGSTGPSEDMYITPSPGVNTAKAIQDWLADSCYPRVIYEPESSGGGVFLDASEFPAADDGGVADGEGRRPQQQQHTRVPRSELTEAYSAGPSDSPPQVPPHRCKPTLPSNTMISPHLAPREVGNGGAYSEKPLKSTSYFPPKNFRAMPQNLIQVGPGAIFEIKHTIATRDASASQTESSSRETHKSNPRPLLSTGRIFSKPDAQTKTSSSGATNRGSGSLGDSPGLLTEGYKQLRSQTASPDFAGVRSDIMLDGLIRTNPSEPIGGIGRPANAPFGGEAEYRTAAPTSMFTREQQITHLPPNPADLPGFDPTSPYPHGTDTRASTGCSQVTSSDSSHDSGSLEVVFRIGRSGVPPTTDRSFVPVSGRFGTPSTWISNESEKDPREGPTTGDGTSYLKGEKEYGTVAPALRRRV